MDLQEGVCDTFYNALREVQKSFADDPEVVCKTLSLIV